MIQRIIKGLKWRLKWLTNIPSKTVNTLYYLLNKKSVLVVNAPLFQWVNKVQQFNIGDDLNYFLLESLSGRKVIAYWSFYHFGKTIPSIMAIGSIIDWMGNSQSTVWGSGILLPTLCQQSDKQQYIINKVVAVRGKKTRACLLKAGIECPEVYGDPALLMPLIYNPQVTKVKGRIGFIPHYKDVKDKEIIRLMNEGGKDAILIKVQKYSNWQDVINQILSCEFIISSSLHGLILSDAYGVPNQWIILQQALPGGNFKFEDYYSAVAKEAVPFRVTEATTLSEILEKKHIFQSITFDPRPLLKACPFEIVHPTANKMLEGNF